MSKMGILFQHVYNQIPTPKACHYAYAFPPF